MTVMEVRGHGRQKGHAAVYRGREYEVGLLPKMAVDIVGPICETADTFARQRLLPPVAAGDLLAICSTGAYGAVMSSTYNGRRLVPEVMVRGNDHAIVRARPDYAAMLAETPLPDWLEPAQAAARGVA